MHEAAALGDVLLVGAGPGPVDLMTLRAARAVESAQALLYDALVSDEAIALAPAGCVRILTGKRSGRPSMKQEAINRLMLRLARRGLRVVRLKGGDPSVFGRARPRPTRRGRAGTRPPRPPGRPPTDHRPSAAPPAGRDAPGAASGG